MFQDCTEETLFRPGTVPVSVLVPSLNFIFLCLYRLSSAGGILLLGCLGEGESERMIMY